MKQPLLHESRSVGNSRHRFSQTSFTAKSAALHETGAPRVSRMKYQSCLAATISTPVLEVGSSSASKEFHVFPADESLLSQQSAREPRDAFVEQISLSTSVIAPPRFGSTGPVVAQAHNTGNGASGGKGQGKEPVRAELPVSHPTSCERPSAARVPGWPHRSDALYPHGCDTYHIVSHGRRRFQASSTRHNAKGNEVKAGRARLENDSTSFILTPLRTRSVQGQPNTFHPHQAEGRRYGMRTCGDGKFMNQIREIGPSPFLAKLPWSGHSTVAFISALAGPITYGDGNGDVKPDHPSGGGTYGHTA